MKTLILASTSPYRAALLKRLGLSFTQQKPDLDEEAEKDPSLSPRDLAIKLAYLKAKSLAGPQKIVIGGDQLVSFQGQILGKPHTRERAIEQLLSMQGHSHDLITAVTVMDGMHEHSFLNVTTLTLRKLSRERITHYVDLDLPLDCAGAYKIEKHGMSLMEKIEGDDWSAIEGLPLIALSKTLQKCQLVFP